jgi:hypothetical protein
MQQVGAGADALPVRFQSGAEVVSVSDVPACGGGEQVELSERDSAAQA